jgi:hypothetical protein
MKDGGFINSGPVEKYVQISLEAVTVHKLDPDSPASFSPNKHVTDAIRWGTSGGYCRCPDGLTFPSTVKFGETCSSAWFGCPGGKSHSCKDTSGAWSNKSVTCGTS